MKNCIALLRSVFVLGLLAPLYWGQAIAQTADSKSRLHVSVEPPWFYEPIIWLVGIALTAMVVLLTVKERSEKI
jgi:hypothetical protein